MVGVVEVALEADDLVDDGALTYEALVTEELEVIVIAIDLVLLLHEAIGLQDALLALGAAEALGVVVFTQHREDAPADHPQAVGAQRAREGRLLPGRRHYRDRRLSLNSSCTHLHQIF